MNMETILKTLSELASIYPDYPGTIERDGMGEIVRLQYFAKPCEMMLEEKRLEWNRAVRDLDDIAPRILEILEGQTIEQAETDGATVMFHFLKDDWKPNRGSIHSITNAFRMISNRIVMSTGTKTEVESIDIVALVNKLFAECKGSHADKGKEMANKLTDEQWEAYKKARTGRPITQTVEEYFTQRSKDAAKPKSKATKKPK